MAVTSSEFFINMKKSDIPPWNPILPFEDQPLSTQQFWEHEAEKVLNGVTINGFYIHPLLYWYLNHWHIPVDTKKSEGNIERHILSPDLRDNELYFIENYAEAQRQGKHLLMFGTRRYGKALWDSELIYTKEGPKPIGLAMFGDKIYDESGNLTTIKGVYPQGMIETYRLTLEDGRSVLCCGEHLWKIKEGEKGHWVTKQTKEVLGKNDLYIPICSSVNYPAKENLPLNHSFYASLLYNYLNGGGDRTFLSNRINAMYIMSSPSQRINFVNEFIHVSVGIETGYDSFEIKRYDKKVIYFIKQMFWASGYYCKTEGNTFIFSKHKKDVKVISIEKEGRKRCTCIEVANDSRLFLTTNHMVTHNTALISNYTGYYSTIRPNSTHTIIGGSARDLDSISDYLEVGLDHVHDYFKFSRIGNDWSNGVVLGAKDKSNIRMVYSQIKILNVDMGKKSSTQKTAGSTPSSAVFDEVGKFDFLGPYLAARPSYMTEYGARLVAILAGTSGEIEKCADVQKVLSDPVGYDIIPMDWDILDRKAKEHATWKRQSWSMFVPGQMALEFPKVSTTLDKLLDIKGKELASIKVKTTDWANATKTIKETLKRLEKGDKKNYANYKMYYPTDPDDCFANSNINRYPVDLAVIRKRELENKGNHGILADVWLNDDRTLGWKTSDKQLATYPFQGGTWDAPVQIFEFPDKAYDFSDYVYAAGADLYKRDTTTNSSSLGSFYIFKRQVRLGDPYANKIVCSYVSRPADMDYFCSTCETLMEAYGCKCLFERADIMLETYLKRKNKAERLLAYGDDITANLVKPGNYVRSGNYGLSTAGHNQTYLESLGVRYTWQDMDVEYSPSGEPIRSKKAIEYIEDAGLLSEYIEYKPGKNVDRIVGFHHALALADYYDYMKFFPKTPIQKEEERLRAESAKKKYSVRSFVKVTKVFR